ncbi:probable 2-ketogluconate reductase [Diadema antillarum]|uniref:probable 2-ketogluconate reductase n=1 Tax=Diadema antillarum TaxID=105358 RepID=UPI003A837448
METDAQDDSVKPWILTTATPFRESSKRLLLENFRLVIWDDFVADPLRYRERIQGFLHIPFYKPEITEEILRSMPNLKVVTTHSTGTNHLNLPLLWKLGLKVGHARGILDDTCADFAFGLLLAAARKLPVCIGRARGYDKDSLNLGWKRTDDLYGIPVSGTTLGVLGMGAIGYEVARRAAGFKMRVLYHNRRKRSEEEEKEVQATYCSTLEEMLPVVDFLVVAAPLNDSTRHVMGKKQLSLMKNTAIIVNIARGLIFDQEALVEALKDGIILGAALDATFPEPLPKEHPLLHMPNVIVTPHVSAFVGRTLDEVMQNCVDNLWAGIQGRPLVTEVPNNSS